MRDGEKSFMDAINYLHVGEHGRDHPSNSPEWAGTAVLRVCVCWVRREGRQSFFFAFTLIFCVISSSIYEATI